MTTQFLLGLHIGCVTLSGGLFILRGALGFSKAGARHWRVWRWLPHVVDTVLLGSALGLAWMIGQYPFVDAWLTAKVLALLLYIALGTIALKRGRTPAIRTLAFVAALLTFLYIVSVALTHDPRGVLAMGRAAVG